MNKKILLIIASVLVLAGLAFGAGLVSAQTPVPGPQQGFGPGRMMGGRGMMGGYAPNGRSDWMNTMHQWMTASGGMHTIIWNSLAEQFGMTNDELSTALQTGKTFAQLAQEKGISLSDLALKLETAVKNGLDKAVQDKVMTQSQADRMVNNMAGRYEWMLQNMGGRGFSYGRMGPNGGCARDWDDSNSNPDQPAP